MNLLAILEMTAFSQWVLTSMLGFPTLIALHSVGMAVAAGLTIVVALYLNDIFTGIDHINLPRFLRLAEWGFMLNLLTGLVLFLPRGTEYVLNVTFLVKMALVLISALILFWLRARLTATPVLDQQPFRDKLARILSLACIGTWIGAIVAGRLIAYVGSMY